MAINWAAASVIIAIIGILCGVFYRLGKVSESKADKATCVERAETCASRFLIADQSVAKLHTAVARVEEQQKAGAKNLDGQIELTGRLEKLVMTLVLKGVVE